MKDKESRKAPSFFDYVLKALILEAAIVSVLILGMVAVKYVAPGIYKDISAVYKTAVNTPTSAKQVKEPQKSEEQEEITVEDITEKPTENGTAEQSSDEGDSATEESAEEPADDSTEDASEPVSSTGINYICDLKIDSSSSINSIIWPVTGTVTSNFGDRDDPISGASSTHGGIDIAVNTGTGVTAAATGTVITAEYNDIYGNYIILEHSNSFKTVYAHCNELCVGVGQNVTQGEVIAKSGSTGRSTGPHLHFEIRIGDKKVNPKWLLPEVTDL